MSLLPVSEAQDRLLAMVDPLPCEDVALIEACGRWAAQDIVARRSQPATDLSAMDGYAIRFADMAGPWTVVGESAAGKAFGGRVEPGQAVRINTGAAVPAGADTVIIQEDVVRDGDHLVLTTDGPGMSGRHIRPAGSDFAAGQRIIPAGTLMTARHIGLAALAGHGSLSLARRPRIALVSSGSELVPPGEPTAPDQIPSSNAVMLEAVLASLHCDVEDRGILPDNLDAIAACFAGLRDVDIVVTTGGASVGDHDLVKPALERAGGAIHFWKIRMRPGKPLIAGHLGPALFLGLPGNPVSAFVTATLFLLPLVRKMAGAAAPLPASKRAILDRDMPPIRERDDYVRGVLRDDRVEPLPVQDSAATLSLAQADCLILRPAGSPAARRGTQVEIIPL